MLKTRLCELLGLDVPIILAPMGTCTSAELTAAVSNEGGLGGIGSLRCGSIGSPALTVGALIAARRRIGRASLSYRLRLRFVHAERNMINCRLVSPSGCL